ncbi:MAG TPA: NAD(P)-dependent oxidoreductase [Candidatus Acidoferrales bacterium]|nr:NAD(P)-dependent oxidoreductase [Candidatus Acidoferrales bacterium]
MRVCVTGATGFIGGALVRRLQAQGLLVRVLARPSARADQLEARGVEVIRGDLKDRDAVERAIEGARVVYHLAAKVRGAGSRKDFIETNVLGTQNVLQACAAKGVPHVVYLSSVAVYGPAKPGMVITEATECDSRSSERNKYAQSKIEADNFAVGMGRKAQLMVTILRPGIVCGPGEPLRLALLGFRVGRLNIIFGKREQSFPFTYVENLVDAIELVGRRTGGAWKSYIVLDDDELTLGAYHKALTQVAKTLTVFLPGWPVLLAALGVDALRWVGWDAGGWPREVRRALQNRHYDSRRIRLEAGWAPKISLEAAIEQTLQGSE